MKKLIVILLFLFVINVSADELCDRNELNRLKNLAKKITYTYEFIETKDEDGNVVGGTFDIILDNVSKEVKPMIIYSWIGLEFDEFVPDSDGTATSRSFNKDGFEPGNTIKITTKAYVDNDCVARDLLVKTVRLPYFNQYVNTETCKIYTDFKLCRDKLTYNKITERQFNLEFEKYMKEKDQGEPVMIIDSNLLYILVGVLIFIPVFILIISYIVYYNKTKEEL